MEHGNAKVRRCAIYTRKSSEEGLEQDFNSLQAQREACEAFIRSQASEGWRLVPTAYDDGGYSGGTLERPALQHLLGDIREHRVDVIVVYKVDRLTRSLADFAKMVDIFDAHGVSFVAVTQQFNTTTSMGRLTLNVLLSFAQFEREVTGERIRDKIAASKRKGMWMGGVAPLGYDLQERRLVVNASEADTVRAIFRRYLKLGCVRRLQSDLARRGIVSKVRISRKGTRSGGKVFSRGALYALLSNPVYIGEIRHLHERYPGQHEALMERKLWDRVHERLRNQAVRRGGQRPRQAPPSALAGKLFDEGGEPLYVQGTAKGARHYRYYVSRALVRGSEDHRERGWRVPAPELEGVVRAVAEQLLADRAALAEAAEAAGIEASRLPGIFTVAQGWSDRLRLATEAAAALGQLTERVDLTPEGVRVALRVPLPSEQSGSAGRAQELVLMRFGALRLRRRGIEIRLVLDDTVPPGRVDRTLLKTVARAYRWADDLFAGRAQSVGEIARREGVSDRYVWRLIRVGFLSPTIVEAIVEGRQPAELTASALSQRLDLPALWQAQEQAFGLA
ncbi:MAG: recombinase family protein [Candidatus Binatia bacterium]|jgi:site-specific DNA recombinase